MYADMLGQIWPLAMAESVLEYCAVFFIQWDETSLTLHALKKGKAC